MPQCQIAILCFTGTEFVSQLLHCVFPSYIVAVPFLSNEQEPNKNTPIKSAKQKMEIDFFIKDFIPW